ncbi:MAG: hypothetical protein ABW051_09355 [Burkholderiaceae bacterium]
MNAFPAPFLKRGFSALLLASSLCALAQDVPIDEPSFAKAAAERIQRGLPGYRIEPGAVRLTLGGEAPNGEAVGNINIERIHASCKGNPAACNEALDRYAKNAARAIHDQHRPIDGSMVRLALRPAGYIDTVRQQAGTATVVYARPMPGGLAAVALLDFSTSARFAGPKDLAKLGVDEAGLFRLGEENLRASLQPLAQAAPPTGGTRVGAIVGEDYASSRILFHDQWKDLSARMNGYLLVMLPAADVLLYGDGSSAAGFDALQSAAKKAAGQSGLPLTPAMLRWTPDGWVEVK